RRTDRAEQAERRVDAVARADVVGLEGLDLDAMPATPLAFAAQAPGVPATAGEVEALRAGDAATREVRSDVDESLDRLDAGPVHHHGRGWADAAREVD